MRDIHFKISPFYAFLLVFETKMSKGEINVIKIKLENNMSTSNRVLDNCFEILEIFLSLCLIEHRISHRPHCMSWLSDLIEKGRSSTRVVQGSFFVAGDVSKSPFT